MTNLMLNVEGLYAEIRSDFDSLWSIKNRNATVEFITPYTTLGDDAISVFVTQRDNGYVVSDGGRLYDTGKEQGVELDGHKGFHYGELTAKFCVKVVEQPQTKRRFFYKMVSDMKMLSAAIYDVAHFQEAMANAVYLDTMFAPDEPRESVYFRRRVNDVLKQKIRDLSSDGKKYEYIRDDKIRFCRFSSGIREIGTNKLWLGMTICRSNINNYRHSVWQAEFGFVHAGQFLPDADLRMSAVVDTLPTALSNNRDAGMLQVVMNGWPNIGIKSYSYGDITGMASIETLFAA